MANQKLGDAFAYYALQSSGSDTVTKWLKVNKPAVDRMLAWSSAFRWSATPAFAPEPLREPTPPGNR